MNINDKLCQSRVVIVSHVYATGPCHSLEQYLRGKATELFFIGHPFVFAKEKESQLRVYDSAGKLVKEKKSPIIVPNQTLSIVKEAILTFLWIVKNGKFDVYIGVDAANTFVGVWLKKFGFVKKVILYTIDYVPQRFPNPLLNSIYHFLDQYAIEHSDTVWNLSSIMVSEREKHGIDPRYRDKQIVVPVGTETEVTQMPFNKIKKFSVGHIGHIVKKQGVQLLIEAIPEIVKKIPQFHAEIIGTGEYVPEVEALAKKLDVSKYVTFHGFIQSHTEAEKLLAQCAIGVAPYEDTPDNFVRYTDPGKVKAYLAVGLPVIITKVPAIAEEIATRKAGFAVDYDKHELAQAIIHLLSNEKTLQLFRKNAAVMGEEYQWDKIFHRAFSASL